MFLTPKEVHEHVAQELSINDFEIDDPNQYRVGKTNAPDPGFNCESQGARGECHGATTSQRSTNGRTS